MRDPNRIDVIVELLRAAWNRSPDLRLGQLLSNVAGKVDSSDMFYLEDTQWQKWLAEWQMKPAIDIASNEKKKDLYIRELEERVAEMAGDLELLRARLKKAEAKP